MQPWILKLHIHELYLHYAGIPPLIEKDSSNFQLNNQQYSLLSLIIRHPSSTPTELAEKMNITKSAISQQLVKLEMEGYIYRKQHSEDKRIYSVELGEKGLLYKNEMEKFSELKHLQSFNLNCFLPSSRN